MFIIKFDNDLFSMTEYLSGSEDADALGTVLDPNFAKTFETRKAAKSFVKKNVAWDVEFKIVTLKHACTTWNRLAKVGISVRTIPVKSKISRPYNNEGPNEVLKWRIEHAKLPENSVSFEDYKTWPDLHMVFEHLHGLQQYWDTDYTQKFVSFQVCVKRDSKFGTFMRELKKVLKHVTLKDDDSNIILDVFDHYLNEYGNSVSLVIIDDDHWKVAGQWDACIEGTPRECFDYLCRERYYE